MTYNKTSVSKLVDKGNFLVLSLTKEPLTLKSLHPKNLVDATGLRYSYVKAFIH